MPANACPTDNRLKDGFSVGEKTLMRFSMYGAIVVALHGIYIESRVAAACYAIYLLVGFSFFLLRSLCTHCPYPTFHDDCLFMPARLVKKIFPYMGPRMTRNEKIAMMGLTAITFLVPQFWLWGSPWHLALFWLLVIPTLVGIPLLICPRCRHAGCPGNQLPGSIRKELKDLYGSASPTPRRQ